MTLVEVVVAVALSTMLMAAIIGVLQGIAFQSKTVEQFDPPVWPRKTTELFRRDLLAAESIWRRNGTVWMDTDSPPYGGSRSGIRRIGYQIKVIRDGSTVLVRTDGQHPHLLAIGPTRLVIERLDEDGIPQPLPSVPGPVPVQIRMSIFGADFERPIVLNDLVVR